jgi:hypothetical protein
VFIVMTAAKREGAFKCLRILFLVACLLLLTASSAQAATNIVHAFGDAGSSERAYAMIEHSIDGGYVVAGTTDLDPSGSTTIMLVKTDSGMYVCVYVCVCVCVSWWTCIYTTMCTVGVHQWTKLYGQNNDSAEVLDIIEHSIDNGLLIVGFSETESFNMTGQDIILVKTDTGTCVCL